jgi:hypothetical protein
MWEWLHHGIVRLSSALWMRQRKDGNTHKKVTK